MKRHPEGAITTKAGFEALIKKAQKSKKPVKFWIVRRRGAQARFIFPQTTVGPDKKWGFKLINYGWVEDDTPRQTYPYGRGAYEDEPLYAFSNYWLAWAYSKRLDSDKQLVLR